MLIRLLAAKGGAGWRYESGDVTDAPDDVLREWIAAGSAEAWAAPVPLPWTGPASDGHGGFVSG